MSARYHVELRAVSPDVQVPGRFAESGLWELVAGLGGPAEGDDVWAALTAVFDAMTESQLGERLLDMILLKPPIPAGCDALLQAMKDEDNPPWQSHEIMEDRFWLWYGHYIVHRVYPDRFPAPRLSRATLAVTTLDPSARPPGPRTSARDRTRFVAAMLGGPGCPLAAAFGEDTGGEWGFDVVWACEVAGRTKLDAATLIARGATEADAESGRLVELAVHAWMAPQWLDGRSEAGGWVAHADS
jgi:hypothetical protein